MQEQSATGKDVRENPLPERDFNTSFSSLVSLAKVCASLSGS